MEIHTDIDVVQLQAMKFLVETRETFKISQNATAHIAKGLTEIMELYQSKFLVRGSTILHRYMKN